MVQSQAESGLADRFIELQSFKNLIKYFTPNADTLIPSRKRLGGILLRDEAKKNYSKMVGKFSLIFIFRLRIFALVIPNFNI